MSLIRAFRGLRPAAGHAGAVAAPPYDVLSSDEARQRAAGKPWSFLHISKPEIDLPRDIDPHAPAVYAKAAENLAKMLAAGVLVRDAAPCYYAYRLSMPDPAGGHGIHVQTGLVAAASVAAYDSNRIRKHEFTRPDKEDDRVRQIEALSAQTGPVLLACPDSPDADTLIARATGGAPVADVTADGVRHTVWVIDDAATIAGLTAVFDAMPNLYIAQEVTGNTFKIAGGVPGKKVSWTVFAQRNDPWLRDHPATDVAGKPANEVGTYLYPQGYGQPASKGVNAQAQKPLGGR